MENGALKYGSNNNNNEIIEEKVVSNLFLLSNLCFKSHKKYNANQEKRVALDKQSVLRGVCGKKYVSSCRR